MSSRSFTNQIQAAWLLPVLLSSVLAGGCSSSPASTEDVHQQQLSALTPVETLDAGALNLPAPRDLYRQAAMLQTSRHLPAVQCESLSLNYTKIEFDYVNRLAKFMPTGSDFGGASFMILPFAIGDLDRDGYPDLRFRLDGTRSQDDGTLRCYLGVADYSRNAWQWEECDEQNGNLITKTFDKASPNIALALCVAFVGGGVFDADSFDLRPDGSTWPAELVAQWDTPDTVQTHTYARWSSDPYAEDALRCYYVDTSTDQLITGALDQGAWRTTPNTSFGELVRNFAQCDFSDGSQRLAYFDAQQFKLRIVKGMGSFPALWEEEYAIPAGGGTPLNSSSVDIIEEPVTHTPRLVFHDESLGGLRFAEPGPLPGELAVSIISDSAAVGRKQKMWMTNSFRCIATDDTAGATGVVQFDFDAAMGWTPTTLDLGAMPYTSPPGVMDAVSVLDNGFYVAYSCPHGLGLMEWQPEMKGGSKVASKTFVVPHILESSGSITKGRIRLDSDGKPVVVALSPLTRTLSMAQWDPVGSQWFTQPIMTFAEGTDCDDVDLYVAPDTDGDGFVDAGVLTACREAASEPGMFRWTLEVRVDRIEMK